MILIATTFEIWLYLTLLYQKLVWRTIDGIELLLGGGLITFGQLFPPPPPPPPPPFPLPPYTPTHLTLYVDLHPLMFDIDISDYKIS